MDNNLFTYFIYLFRECFCHHGIQLPDEAFEVKYVVQ